jgi:hypothetical protein
MSSSSGTKRSAASGGGAGTRIDELIGAQKRRAFLVGSAGTAVDEQMMSLADLVAQTRGMYTGGDGVGTALLAAPYQVNGLSQDVPNEQYALLQIRRQRIETRLEQVRAQHSRLCGAAASLPACALDEPSSVANALDRQRRALALQRQEALLCGGSSGGGSPLPLLKPLGEARALNAYWRNLLGGEIASLLGDYTATTEAALVRAGQPAAIADASTRALVVRVVEPVLQSYVSELQRSTYEDMPHTRELLRGYLRTLLDLVLEAETQRVSAANAARGDDDDDDDDDDDQIELPAGAESFDVERLGRAYHFVLDRAAARLLVAAAAEDGRGADALESGPREQAIAEVAYLQETLVLHANDEDFGEWLGEWRSEAGRFAALPDNVADLVSELCVRVVKNLLDEARRRAAARRECGSGAGTGGDFAVQPVALDEAQVREYYRNLMRADVAHFRARSIVDAGDQLAGVLARALAVATRLPSAAAAEARESLDQLVPPALLVVQRSDRFVVLAAQRRQLERSATVDERAKIVARERALRALLLEWAIEAPPAAPAAPLDTLELCSVVDATAAARSLPALFSAVQLDGERFNAQAAHERANVLREMVSYVYAERLLQREAVRLVQALEEMAQPTRPAALVVDLDIDDLGTPVLFEATAALRDELVVGRRVWGGNSVELVREINRAERQLSSSRITVTWFHRRTDGTEVVVRGPEDLAAGTRTSRLQLVSDSTSTLELAGWYRAEFTITRPAPPQGAGGAAAPAQPALTVASRFVARVRITAVCARDCVRYEVGDSSAVCQWRGADVQENLSEQLERRAAYAVLMGHDEAKVRANLAKQAKLLRSPLRYVPPWGSDSDSDVQRTLEQYNGLRGSQNGTEMRERFRYQHIVSSIVARLALGVRNTVAANRLGGNADAVLAELIAKRSDWAVFALLVDKSTIERRARPNDQVESLWDRIREEAARGKFLDDESERGIGDGAALSDRFLSDEPELHFSAPSLATQETLLLDRLRFDSATGIEHTPIASVLLALTVPRVWANLAPAECRFVQYLFERYETLAQGNGCCWRNEWVSLAMCKPSDVPLELRDDLLLDRQLVADFRQLVASLARRGLVLSHRPTSGDRTVFLPRDSACGGRLAPRQRDCESAGSAHWIGEHSHTGAAPALYDVDYQSGKIKRVGSMPLCSYAFDFSALRSEIEALVRKISTLVLAPRGAQPDAALERLVEHAKARVLLYNSLVLFFSQSPIELREQRAIEIAPLRTQEQVRAYFRRIFSGSIELF